jgi:hypothetical protein
MMLLLIPIIASAIPKAFCQIHEIEITKVTPEPTAVYQGWTMMINVTVANNGDGPEDFNVTAYYDTTLIGKQIITAMPASSSMNVTFSWVTTSVPYANYTINANATILEGETNTDNNKGMYETVQVKILGDADGNGDVELNDAYKMANAFGSFPGHPRWDIQADLNQDGIIDLIDFYVFGLNYGKSV